MTRVEKLLACGTAGLLAMAAGLTSPGDSPEPETRRRIPFLTAAAGGHPDTQDEERLLGRRDTLSFTVVAPELPKAACIPPNFPVPDPPPNMIAGGFARKEKITLPVKVSLLSRSAPVTSSDPAPIGDLSLVTDGDKNFEDGYFVDLLPGKQWVQIDLGESREIWLVWSWMFHKAPVMYNDVIIRISDDPAFATARTVFNNDFDNSSGMGQGTDEAWIETNCGHPVKVNGVRGRYISLYSNGRSIDDTNQWTEVEVYGR